MSFRLRTRPGRSLALLALIGTSSCDRPVERMTLEGDVPIAYWQVGRGSPTTIVLHGGPGVPHGYLRPEFDRLAAIGRVVYYDQRGCGASDQDTAASWEDHVADLDRLVGHLGEGRVNLAGSSWGAYLALLYAVRHPDRVRALVLSSPPEWEWGDRWSSPEEQWERLSPAVRESIIARARAAAARARLAEDSAARADRQPARGDASDIPPPLPPTIGPHQFRFLPRALRDSLFGPASRADGEDVRPGRHHGPWSDPERYGVDSAFGARFTEVCGPAGSWMLTLKQRPGREALRALDVPVLILEGEEARERAGLELAELLPRATHVAIPGAGHDPWYNDPDRFFAEATRFLAAR